MWIVQQQDTPHSALFGPGSVEATADFLSVTSTLAQRNPQEMFAGILQRFLLGNSLLTVGFPLSVERVCCVIHAVVYLFLRNSLCLTVITQTQIKSNRIRIPLFFSSFLATQESTLNLARESQH